MIRGGRGRQERLVWRVAGVTLIDTWERHTASRMLGIKLGKREQRSSATWIWLKGGIKSYNNLADYKLMDEKLGLAWSRRAVMMVRASGVKSDCRQSIGGMDLDALHIIYWRCDEGRSEGRQTNQEDEGEKWKLGTFACGNVYEEACGFFGVCGIWGRKLHTNSVFICEY